MELFVIMAIEGVVVQSPYVQEAGPRAGTPFGRRVDPGIPQKWTFTRHRHPGRPSTPSTVKQLILRLTQENNSWGHRRIQGELARLGHPIAPSTVWEIQHSSGVGPAPQRSGPTWRQFLTTQAHGIIAADFLHLDTVALKRLYALIFIEHGTRRLHLAVRSQAEALPACDFFETVTLVVQALRERAGLSREQVAERVRFSQHMVVSVEPGRRCYPAETGSRSSR
ncbi:helix-turn-helix domain-containing protein [Streptomyces sp. NPDC051956]|uniref:helix-turn-helix domain-containing protein n=1 Tax=Streptomyces sp. NPDC051956 TaxID=3365677 RepID=UPI0037D8471C